MLTRVFRGSFILRAVQRKRCDSFRFERQLQKSGARNAAISLYGFVQGRRHYQRSPKRALLPGGHVDRRKPDENGRCKYGRRTCRKCCDADTCCVSLNCYFSFFRWSLVVYL